MAVYLYLAKGSKYIYIGAHQAHLSTSSSGGEMELERSLFIVDPITRFLDIGINMRKPADAPSSKNFQVLAMFIEQVIVVLKLHSIS